jgi:hypothetical protein
MLLLFLLLLLDLSLDLLKSGLFIHFTFMLRKFLLLSMVYSWIVRILLIFIEHFSSLLRIDFCIFHIGIGII